VSKISLTLKSAIVTLVVFVSLLTVAKALFPMPWLFDVAMSGVVSGAVVCIFLRYHEKIVSGITRLISYSPQKVRDNSLAEIVRLLWKDRLSRMAMIYMGLFMALGIMSFIWTPYDYRVTDFDATRQGPSLAHWFGTDLIGRDMFTRVLYAARITNILIVMTIVVGGLPLSILLGVASGYFGGKVDWGIMRFGELFVAVPALLFILLLTATMRPLYDEFLFNLGTIGEWSIRTGVADLILIFFVTSLIFWVGGARLYRSQVLNLRNAPFVEGARMLGAGNRRIISKYILPQLYPFIAHSALLMFAGVIGTEIALSFFGIGIRPPHPSFGMMFSESANV